MDQALLDIVLDAYRDGAFPMAEEAHNDSFAFYKPKLRALLPLETLHVPRKLAKIIRNHPHRVSLNKAFSEIIKGCAAQRDNRPHTWINTPIQEIFLSLHHAGYAHSLEVWDKEGALMGGLYGLALGRVFCGESMVSFQTDGSKIALVHLCAALKEAGYTRLDSQFANDHLRQFGLYEMPQATYEALIAQEMNQAPRHALTESPIGRTLVLSYLENLKSAPS